MPRCRKRIVVVAACLIYGTALFQPSRLNAVEPLTALSLLAVAASSFIGIFDSGSDLTRTIVEQNHTLLLDNRQLLNTLHDRFSSLGRAFARLYEKMDDFPMIVREELMIGIDEFQQNKVLATVRLIVEDRQIQKDGGTLASDPRDRLRTLQQESRTLFERSDFNVPVLMIAMAYESALLAAMEASPEEKAERQRAYLDRLLLSLDTQRKESLLSRYSFLVSQMRTMFRRQANKFSKLRAPYHDTGCEPGDYQIIHDGCFGSAAGRICVGPGRFDVCEAETPRPNAERRMRAFAREMRLGRRRIEEYYFLGEIYSHLISGTWNYVREIARAMAYERVDEYHLWLESRLRELSDRRSSARSDWSQLGASAFEYVEKSPSFWSYVPNR